MDTLEEGVERGRVQVMRVGPGVWQEVREVAWLASVVWGLSIAGVGLAVVLALTLDAWAGVIMPAVAGHI